MTNRSDPAAAPPGAVRPATTTPSAPLEAAIEAVVAASALAADRGGPGVAEAIGLLRRTLLPRLLPVEMTPAVGDLLGQPYTWTGPFARRFRAAGVPIKRLTADEHAFVLFAFLPLALEHGDDWWRAADERLHAAEAAAAARRLPEGGRI